MYSFTCSRLDWLTEKLAVLPLEVGVITTALLESLLENCPHQVNLVAVMRQWGGSFNNLEAGRTCDFDFTVGGSQFSFNNAGFRCCMY